MSKYKFDAVIFDLDGVVTKTANVHSRAWKKMFDDFLLVWSKQKNIPFVAFQTSDYLQYVDGKPRYEGVKSFLQSRNILLNFGSPDDDPELITICGLGNRKNIAFNEILKTEGVEAYPSTIALMEKLKKNNIHIGVASSSKNCEAILKSAQLENFIETRVDGVVSANIGLKGKPAPDIFIQAAENMGVAIHRSVVVEDASSGVAAGKKGNFGLVIGLAREDNKQELLSMGADVVVEDLIDFGFEKINEWFEEKLENDNWSITYNDFIPEKEKSRETLLSVGNGFFGNRGAMLTTKSSDSHYPGTYIAGLYNRLTSKVGDRNIENEDFVNCPDWFSFQFCINKGDWINLDEVIILSIQRKLDFRSGLLCTDLLIQDNDGNKTAISSSRYASMDDPHLAEANISINPINYDGEITIKSGINGDIINDGVARYRQLNQKHISVIETGSENGIIYLTSKTTQSKIIIAQAVKHNFFIDNRELKISNQTINKTNNSIDESFSTAVTQGRTLKLQKILSIYSSHTFNTKNPQDKAIQSLKNNLNFDELLHKSKLKWSKIWEQINIVIEGDRQAQKLIRLHLYHLMISLSPHNANIDASITARGLHGEAYRGHIFWDELFILPLYNIHFPEVSKAALMYRFNRLDAAKKYASEHGFEGAMFPWQSGSDGREETQSLHLNPISGKWGDDYSSYQRHVSLAIAYNIWQYFHVTEDKDFLNNYGAEMFFEICLFWASKSQFNLETGRYSIQNVMGPDEFHEKYEGADEGGLKDNAYTNLMVVWMLKKALQIIDITSQDILNQLLPKIGLKIDDLKKWEDIIHKMNIVIKNDIIAQYDGYLDLKELDWDYYRKKYGNIYRLDRILKSENKSADHYKVAKQADTLQTFYNLDETEVTAIFKSLGYELSKDYLHKNLNYYLKRTSHGSTLSRVVHAQLANMIKNKELSWELYHDALTSDYSDIQGGTTSEGIHAGVMAGTVLIALQSFAGLNLKGNIIDLNPNLPKHWELIKFSFTFKRINYSCMVTHKKISIKHNFAKDLEIIIKGNKQIAKTKVDNEFIL